MASLTKAQLAQLTQRIQQQFGVDATDNHELLDHVASMVEQELEQGLAFEKALTQVLQSFSRTELQTLNLSTYGLWSQLRNRKYAQKYTWVIGALLCLWIFGEYLSATLFHTPELGALYGLLSMVILTLGLYQATKHFTRFKPTERISFGRLFWYQMKIVAAAAVIVVLFLLPYLGFVNTAFYGLYEGTPPIPPFPLSITIMIGMFLGVLLEGSLVSLFITWWQQRQMRLSQS